MITTKFRQTKDVNGYIDDRVNPVSNLIYCVILQDNTPITILVPFEFPRYVAVFSYAFSRVFVAVNQTAVAPTSGVSLSGSVLNPDALEVVANDTISLLTIDDGQAASVILYGLQNI